MANILWAFATLDVQPGTGLLEAGAHRMLELLPTTKPQALSNTMWAFATLGYNPGVCPSAVRPLLPCPCLWDLPQMSAGACVSECNLGAASLG